MSLIRRAAASSMLLALAACGGGSGGPSAAASGGSAAQAPLTAVPSRVQSAGGIWHGVSTQAQPLTFFVSEDGTLRVAESPSGTLGPAFGGGAVVVTPDDKVSGSYGAARLPAPPGHETRGETCTFDGELRERVSMTLEIECIEDGGTGRAASLTLAYDADYEADASLAALAGNYTLAFREQTNVLTIGADGAIFGLYDNGPSCTVNGLAAVVDPAYNLYRIEWQLSGCSAPFARYEGAVLTGLATREPRGAPAGSFILLLTGIVDAALESVTVLYEPT